MIRLFSTVIVCLALTINIKAQTSVPFVLSSGQILIKAKIEGVEGNFIFDTGAGQNVLLKSFAKKIPAKSTYNFFVGHRATGDALTVPVFHADDLEIGSQHFKNQLYSTVDIDFPGFDGLISMQTFQNTPVIIDYEKKVLVLGEIKKGDKKRYIDIQLADEAGKSLDIFTYVKVNDKITVQVILDSGSGENSFSLSSRLLNALGLNKSSFNAANFKSDFDSSKNNNIYTGTLAKISTLNDLAKVEKPVVHFVDGLIYEGKMSINWLGKKLGISIPEKRIYILD